MVTSSPSTQSATSHGWAPPLTSPASVWSARHSHRLSPMTLPALMRIIVEARCSEGSAGPPTRANTSWRKPGFPASPGKPRLPHSSSESERSGPACSRTPATRTPPTSPTRTAGAPRIATSVARPRPSRTWLAVCSRRGASSWYTPGASTTSRPSASLALIVSAVSLSGSATNTLSNGTSRAPSSQSNPTRAALTSGTARPYFPSAPMKTKGFSATFGASPTSTTCCTCEPSSPAPQAVPGAPVVPTKTMFHTPPSAELSAELRVKYCCCDPYATCPRRLEFARKPPLAYPAASPSLYWNRMRSPLTTSRLRGAACEVAQSIPRSSPNQLFVASDLKFSATRQNVVRAPRS
mmetsp:Transcript_96151/g.261138  ORF Transcript_96151/g.261138 Transcript_96151/m.261138 type:complete len:351 (+) Transcript_96151:491-1543(+)